MMLGVLFFFDLPSLWTTSISWWGLKLLCTYLRFVYIFLSDCFFYTILFWLCVCVSFCVYLGVFFCCVVDYEIWDLSLQIAAQIACHSSINDVSLHHLKELLGSISDQTYSFLVWSCIFKLQKIKKTGSFFCSIP